MKEYFCVGSYLPFETINKSQLNNSTAKQTFSFGKSRRFSDHKPKYNFYYGSCNVVSYSASEFKTKNQGPFITSSKRQKMYQPNENPPPGNYRIRTEPQEHHFSFGLSRQNVKATDYLNIEASKYPSSTKYEVISQLKKIYNNAPIFSMKKRHPALKQENCSPGPGKYHLGKSRNLEITKYKSISFSAGKQRRFAASQSVPPGPGAYRQSKLLGDQYKSGLSSRFHSSLGTKFSHARRRTFYDGDVKEKISVPGPGNYQSPSEFGQYDGDIYKTFELSGNKGHDVIILENDSLASSSKKPKRPLTSKN